MLIRSLSLILSALLAPSVIFAETLSAGSATGQPGSGFGPIIFLVAILAFMYFLVWRPQQKKAKQHRALVAAVAVGDEVLLSSGIVGIVAATHDHYLSIRVQEGTNFLLQRAAVTAVLPRGTLEAIK